MKSDHIEIYLEPKISLKHEDEDFDDNRVYWNRIENLGLKTENR